MGGGDRILTMDEYWDAPDKGIVEYRGRPHYYDREWDAPNQEYGPIFHLIPLDDATFKLAMEAWNIWLEWEASFKREEVKVESHPGGGPEDSRYKQLHRALDEYLEQHRRSSFVAKGHNTGFQRHWASADD